MGMLLLNGSTDFNPRTLFANNEQGLWLDPSDMTATKAGWRRNLLGYTEQLNNSYWFLSNATVTANAATPPGESSAIADKVIATAASGQHTIESAVVMTAGFVYTATVTAKADGIRYLTINSQGVASQGACFDLQNGTLAIAAGVFVTATNITNLGGGWYTITMTFTNSWGRLSLSLNNSASNAFDSYAGDGVNGILLTKVQLELASSASEYQPITDFSTEFKAAFPTHTLYQDSNGVTPCTAAGDPVGLILDQSRGGLSNLGPELVTNGDFSNGQTGWVDGIGIPSGWSFTGGALVCSNASGGYDSAGQFVVGKWYRATITISNYGGGGVSFSTGSQGTGTIFNSNGTFVVLLNPHQTGPIGIIRRTSNFTGTIDNVSVREVPGNHAYQTTSASRPTLARIPVSGRRNLLTRTEEFDNAAWTKSVATATANTHTAFDGTTTADTLEDTSSGGYGVVLQSYTFLNVAYTFAIDIRKTSGTPASFPGIQCGPASIFHIIHTTNGTVSSTAGGQTCTVTSLDSNWWRVVVNFTPTAGADRVAIFPAISSDSTTLSTAAVGTVIVSRAQLELGSSATNYQKVTATTDVTESGFNDLWHLVFDGSDDSLVTNSVDFTATDEMTVIAGVRKLSDAANACIAELSATISSNAGSFAFFTGTPIAAGGELHFAPRGTAAASSAQAGVSAAFASPVSLVATAFSDISNDSSAMRINGVASGTIGIGDQGSGNFGNYQLFIGRRNQASFPYNGHLYQLIIRGKTTPTGKLLEAERFTAKKTGVSF